MLPDEGSLCSPSSAEASSNDTWEKAQLEKKLKEFPEKNNYLFFPFAISNKLISFLYLYFLK